MWPPSSGLGQSSTMNIILEVKTTFHHRMTPKNRFWGAICDQRPGCAPAVQNEFYYLYYSGGFSWRQDFSFEDYRNTRSFHVPKCFRAMSIYQKKSVQIPPFLKESPAIRLEAVFNSRACKADRPASPPVSPTAATLPCMCFLIDASLSLYCSIILQPFVPVPRLEYTQV
jgi:hypothetical protein